MQRGAFSTTLGRLSGLVGLANTEGTRTLGICSTGRDRVEKLKVHSRLLPIRFLVRVELIFIRMV